MDEQVAELSQLKQNYRKVVDIQEIQGRTVKITSQCQRQFYGREENLTVDADLAEEKRVGYHKTVDESTGKRKLRRNALQLMRYYSMHCVLRIVKMYWDYTLTTAPL